MLTPMATLTAWRFDTPSGADAATATVRELVRVGAVSVLDLAVVRWTDGERTPTASPVLDDAAPVTLGAAFWGMLFGLVFYIPLLGASVGAATGALAGTLTDVGIDDGFIHQVRDQVTPGTSALFLIADDDVVERVRDALQGALAELVLAELGLDQERALREVFEEAG